MILSHYKQKVKGGVKFGSIEEFFRDHCDDYDYFKKLCAWKVFASNVTVDVVVYESIRSSGIVDSFFELLESITRSLGFKPVH